MKKQKKKRQSSQSIRAIGLRLGVFAYAMWLAACALLTHSVATELYTQMQLKAQKFVSFYAESTVNQTEEKLQLPGYPEYCRVNAIDISSMYFRTYSNSPLFPPIPKIVYGYDYVYMPYDVAIGYRDSEGKIIDTAGDYLAFPYMTTDLWKTAQSREELSGFTYIDLNKVNADYYTQEGKTIGIFSAPHGFGYETGRFTGYFEDNAFIPVSVDYSTWNNDAIFGLDRKDEMVWNNIYQAPTPDGKEIVTIYGVDDFEPSMFFAVGVRKMGLLTIDGKECTLEEAMYHHNRKDSLMDAVVCADDSYVDTSGEEISVWVAMRAKPLPYAVSKLVGFYIVSFLVMALVVWLILRKINRNLAEPVALMARCSTGEPRPLPEHPRPQWQEGRTLQENYEALVTDYHGTKAEARQLRIALDYAQNAERKRREMISNITHELKTPLAVIHSYAEGLKDGIAADKQEQYLTVIQEEADRMDAMVLEMLDLSRLEAGKVRLAQDRFSLLGLTRSIFDRLAPMSEEKGLQIHYYIAEEFEIIADEGRIGQVITNFASNAIKYTPAGGNIWIKIYRFREQTLLSIENECDPLTEEALTRVWDSFYRTESSRTSKGTGLGLTIAKAIIELHGGTVGASNTQTGVEFRFTLP